VKTMMRVAALSIAMLSLGSVASVQAAGANIAVVDIGKVLREIPQRKAIESKLKSEFDSRVRDMQRMETEGQTLAAKLKKDESFMSADERTKSQRKLAELQADFNLKGQALQEDQRRRFNEEQQKVFEKIQTNV
jgi:outer membrane protein